MKLKQSLLAGLLSIICTSYLNKASAYDLIVAQDGSGNYTTVQAAINAAPAGQTVPYTIFVKNGRYKEKITIPSNKPFIQLIGESVSNVILTFDDYAAKLITCNTTVGTQNSASFTVNANDFAAFNITFVNSFGDGSQAVAVLVNADRAVFKNCRFLGNQDTLYLKGIGTPRAYFNNCYIDGNVDFIFGSSIALFDSCVIYAKTRPATTSSYITAPNTPNGQAYGFVFKNARLPMNNGNTLYYLSRPWPSPDVVGTRQKTVLLSSVLSSHIQPTGWSIWDANTITANLYYGEYNSKYFNGSLADISQRVAWSYQLNATDSATYTFVNLFGTWDPCAVAADVCTPGQTPLAVSNFTGVKGTSSSTFSWNISWPIPGVQYLLLRSTDNINFSSVYSTTATTDTAINFSFTDNSVPASGTAYYYYLSASAAGYPSHITDTIKISNEAQIAVNAPATLSLCGFSQALGTPSAAQTYTVAASNLTGNLVITPPANYEVSVNTSTWFTNSSPLNITPASGTVVTTTIYIRLNASATGFFSGSIINASTGAVSMPVAVSGNTAAAPTSVLLQQWPLTANTADSAAVRSLSVTASSSTLNNLFASDGSTTSASIPSYSGQYGQPLGANATGNNWSNVGGTLKRAYYEQFTITAAPGYSVRVDSITFQSDFYLTTSNIKMAAVYSKTGFTTNDSTEFLNGVNGSGASLVLSTSGTFTKSFPILRNDAGPVNYYALSLNGVSGVTINPGETITIRLYWACGSTGTPRFAFLKNVKVMGLFSNTLPVQLLSFNAGYENKKLMLHWATSSEQNLDRYEVQRSADGNNFSDIASVIAKNAATGYSYSIQDKFPLYRDAFYRLKIIDKDGSFTYSSTVLVKASLANWLRIYPNPVSNYALISLPVSDTYQVRLFNAMGSTVLQQSFAGTGWPLKVNSLAPGTYLITISNARGDIATQPIIIN